MSRILKTGDNQITQSYKSGVHNGIDNIKYKGMSDYIIVHSDGEVVGVRSTYKTQDKSGNSYGNYVKIKHANGYYTLYAHLKYGSVKVKKGDKVKKGQVIGYMGATGHSTGVHLHFEVRNTKDVRINPTAYINADLPNMKTTTSAEQKKPSAEKNLEIITASGVYGRTGGIGFNKPKVAYKKGTIVKKVTMNVGKANNYSWFKGYVNNKLVYFPYNKNWYK